MSAKAPQPVWTCPMCLLSYWTDAPRVGEHWIKCWGCGALYRPGEKGARSLAPKPMDLHPQLRKLGERDGWRCWLCTKKVDPRARDKNRAPTRDHVIPRSRGGSNRLDNLRLAHAVCNRRRGDKPAPQPAAGEETR